MNYYLDIETTGLDELHDKIITIQYMELERNTANPCRSAENTERVGI